MNTIQKSSFDEVILLIETSKQKVFSQVNSALIELYWNIGEYISNKTFQENWGKSVVKELSLFIKQKDPSVQGFSDKNLWRMKQFFETYKNSPKLSPLVREITWTNNLLILSAAKNEDEREFYIQLSIKERYSKRELERQIKSSIKEGFVYATEADVLNMALFGMTAKEWLEANSDKEGNIRDYASVEQLVVLSNMESVNAELIKQGMMQSDRLVVLNSMAISQMKSLLNNPTIKKLGK
jgi:predicted nuclease of restriction endonuclease-like (RecB) superfamily